MSPARLDSEAPIGVFDSGLGGLTVASALAFFLAPVIYYLNLYYCMTISPKEDKVFYPNRFDRWFGWFSLAVVGGMRVILILWRICVPLFGS